MKRLLLIAFVTLTMAAPGAEQVARLQSGSRPVLFVLQRNHRLTLVDPDTLAPFGAFITGGLGDGLAVRADGRMVFLLQPMPNDPHACCSLRSIDLQTRRMCVIQELGGLPPPGEMVTWAGEGVIFQPHGSGLMTADFPMAGRRSGADVIDRSTKALLRRIQPRVFFRALIIGRDGRTLFGVEDWPRGVPVRLMRIDLATGAIQREAQLKPGTQPGALEEQWSLAIADVPLDLIPRGEVTTASCASPR